MKKNRKLRRADSPFNFILTFGTLLLGILFVWIMKLEMDTQIETGLKKFGAMLGDHVEVGCNSVLNPGTVIGPNSNIYPTSCVRGWKT